MAVVNGGHGPQTAAVKDDSFGVDIQGVGHRLLGIPEDLFLTGRPSRGFAITPIVEEEHGPAHLLEVPGHGEAVRDVSAIAMAIDDGEIRIGNGKPGSGDVFTDGHFGRGVGKFGDPL